MRLTGSTGYASHVRVFPDRLTLVGAARGVSIYSFGFQLSIVIIFSYVYLAASDAVSTELVKETFPEVIVLLSSNHISILVDSVIFSI